MPTTKTRPDLAAAADAIHALPGPRVAPAHHVPPQEMLPPSLHDARQVLADARSAWERCEAERQAAVVAQRAAPAARREQLAAAVADGIDPTTLTDPRAETAAQVELLREARRAAEISLQKSYWDWQHAVETHRQDLLEVIRPVHDHDLAEVERLRQELTTATAHLAASRGALTWATSCQPGDRENRRPYAQA